MLAPVAFAPQAVVSRAAVRCDAPVMSEAAPSRRELFAKAGAAAAAFAAVQGASAKAGQFSKLSVFDLVGQPAISSPFQAGGPKAGPDATFGYAKSDGPILSTGYAEDVSRELKDYKVSSAIVKAQANNIEKKTWWLVRDNFRGQAYNMKSNMLSINKVLEGDKKAAAGKAYSKFWSEVNQLDLAVSKKELELAKKEYEDCMGALAEYEAIVL